MNLGFFPVFRVIKDNRKWIALALLIFTLGFFVFYISYNNITNEQVLDINQEMFASLEGIIEIITNSHPFYGTLLIFVNNLVSSLQMLFLGILLGLSPLFTLLANGAILGTLSNQVIAEGISVWFLIIGILPHGIPELAAFFICAAFGLKIGIHGLISPLPGKNRLGSIKFIWKEIISVLPLVVLLLLVAAFIEIYITQWLILQFFH